ncbi:hypothetical protein [Streptomyces melanogenes]|uniref:hypothetical protein n=1 Tax=Streptomyces melanogenes TaxID=67326 RepID=UPI0037B10348
MDDEAMFVRTQSLQRTPQQHMPVRVHTPMGSAVVLWHGAPQEADGQHLVEWTVDEAIHWGQNTHPARAPEPELRQEGDQVLMSGRLRLTDDGAACLQMGHWQVLLDLVSPVPGSLDGSWVQISVGSASVALYPYQI